MGELNKLAADGSALRKRADDLEAQIADAERRLSKLESKEDWPAFCGATIRAPIVVNLHEAPRMVQ